MANANRQRSACSNKYLSSSANKRVGYDEAVPASVAPLAAANNGVYVGAMLKPSVHNVILRVLALPFQHLTVRQLRVAVYFGVLIVCASVYETVVIGHLCANLLLPLFAIACGYYWLAVAYRNTWSSTSIYFLFCACYVGEVIVHIIAELEQDEVNRPSSHLQHGMPITIQSRGLSGLYLLLSQAPLLLTVSAAGYLSSLRTVRENVVVGGLVFVSRMLAVTQLTALPRSIRPFVSYTAGLLGIVMAKYMEAVLNRPREQPGPAGSNASSQLLLPSTDGGGRMCAGRRRRASSSANLQVHGPKGRRTSLPAISLQKNHQLTSNQGMTSVDMALLAEAHGLITDMLADGSLPPHVTSGLRALASLLSPPSHAPIQRMRFSSEMNGATPSSQADDIPGMGERLSALPKKFRRSFQASLVRRMSSSTWTTTTSATGMPTLEPEPCRKRSTSFRNPPDLITSSSPTSQLLGVQERYLVEERAPKYRSYSTTSLMVAPSPHRRLSRERKTVCSLHPLTLHDISRLHFLSDAAIAGAGGGGGGTEAISDGEASDTSGEAQPMALRLINPSLCDDQLPVDVCFTIGQSPDVSPSLEQADLDALGGRVIKVEDGSQYELDRLAEDQYLERINEWDYPIFDLQLLNHNSVLSKMCYRVFLEAGLFETFRIPLQEFFSYFHALECGYRDKPYHNRMHAADVLHAVFYLTTQPIPGFTHLPIQDSPPPILKSDGGVGSPGLVQRQSFNAEDTYGIMGANLPALELMALYTAAAMHDYEHPGRTNAFLVTTYAPQAILYNDRSVLENHHAAAAWSLFLSKPEYNFLYHLDKAEFKRFRFLVIEAILATDLKRHFEILAEFNAKACDEDAPGIDWNLEADRLLAMEMCIKLADINGPCKKHDIHVQWTKRIADEFYEQGDEEARLGLPISPFMDRKYPQLAKLQDSFINHLVAPLCTSYGEAGFLPGQWVQGEESEDEIANEDIDEQQNGESEKQRQKKLLKRCKIVSLQAEHLKENHDHWAIKVREEQQLSDEGRASGSCSPEDDPKDDLKDDQSSMETIDEEGLVDKGPIDVKEEEESKQEEEEEELNEQS